MKLSLKKPTLSYWLALLLSFHALLFYGFPIAALLTVWVLLALWFLFAGGTQALLAAASLAVGTLLLNFAIQATGLERSIYYRPHELMSAKDADFGGIYKPNTQFSMNALFGDIEAMEKVGIKEPHETAYHTDRLGFRNSARLPRAEVRFGRRFLYGWRQRYTVLFAHRMAAERAKT